MDPMATFDVDHQLFDLRDRSGTEFAASMDDLRHFIHDNTSTASIYALQIGAAASVLVMLVILTKPDKRRSPVFILNSLALLFTIIASALLCFYWLGPWRDVFNYLSADYSTVPDRAVVRSVLATLFVLAVIVCLETSLVLQVHVVCVTLPRARRIAILSLSGLVAGLAVITYVVQTAFRIKVNQLDRSTNYATERLTQARDVALAVSICFFSLIFCLKLGWSMHRRHKLGIGQLGPMQIILIGGTQTMVIPVIFVILQFAYPKSRASSLITTVTAISLPLTALWASASSAATAAAVIHEGPFLPLPASGVGAPSSERETKIERGMEKRHLGSGSDGSVALALGRETDVEMQTYARTTGGEKW